MYAKLVQIVNYPSNLCYVNTYISISVYHQQVCWMCFFLLYINSAGGTKYEFIIAGRGENCMIEIECLHQYIYPFHINVVNVLYRYKLSRCVT